jgi:hypothetical protein
MSARYVVNGILTKWNLWVESEVAICYFLSIFFYFSILFLFF